jgi:NADPH:quinone reductase-like Zn-dependent oxidoreductase
VCVTASAGRAEFLAGLGATRVFDHAAGGVRAAADGGPYDVILDAFGNASFSRCAAMLAPGGTYVTLVPGWRNALDAARTRLLRALLRALPVAWRPRGARLVVVRPNQADLRRLVAAVDAGELRPAVDAVYDLEDVASAHEHVERKHTRGKVLLRVQADEATARTRFNVLPARL